MKNKMSPLQRSFSKAIKSGVSTRRYPEAAKAFELIDAGFARLYDKIAQLHAEAEEAAINSLKERSQG